MKRRRAVAAWLLVAPLMLELTVGEFVTLQRETPAQLRARFDLPVTCVPRIAAVGRDRSYIIAIVRCQPGRSTDETAEPRDRDRR
jgi:hypothetical protein